MIENFNPFISLGGDNQKVNHMAEAEKGYDLDKGAILLKDEDIFHGADAINTICKQINNPSSSLLFLLSRVFKSNKRTNLIFPLLVRARRFALISKGISISLV